MKQDHDASTPFSVQISILQLYYGDLLLYP